MSYTACAARLTRRWDWVAGVFGAGIFLALHSAEGPQLAVERELLIGVLTALSCVVFFEAIDRHTPSLLLIVGFLGGVSTSIKPTYLLLTLAFLAIAARQVHKDRRPFRPYALWGCTGLLFAFACDLAFLLHYHALRGFYFVLTRVLPAYHDIAHMRFYVLLFASTPWIVFVLCAASLPLFHTNNAQPLGDSSPSSSKRTHPHRVHRDWHWWTLFVMAAFGLLSFLAQGKGYLYHRYVFVMFLLLLLSVEVFSAIAKPGWPGWLACSIVGFTLLLVIPSQLVHAWCIVGQSSFEMTLEQDLRSLAEPPALNDKVQCFDMVYGCLNALYHLKTVENSGFTGDMLLFPVIASEPSRYYQEKFWLLARSDPAPFLVISNGLLGEYNSYSKLDRWPDFKSYLATHYDLVRERHFLRDRFGYENSSRLYPAGEADSYRIYQLRR